jgi:hypothetical protein
MSIQVPEPGARYRWGGWTVGRFAAGDVALDRLTETHEYFHRQLDDTTAFGGLVTTCAALADANLDPSWARTRDRLQTMSDLVHEVFATGMSLLTTQRPLQPVVGHPMYDHHIAIIRQLIGEDIHPWVALAAVRAVATACMQSPALAIAAASGLANLEPADIPRPDRPNHRLAALLRSEFGATVQSEQAAAERDLGHQAWCFTADSSKRLRRRLRPPGLPFSAATAITKTSIVSWPRRVSSSPRAWRA